MANSRRSTSHVGPLLVLVIVVLTLYFAREVLAPLALALTLSFVLAPLVTRLQQLKLGRIPAVLCVMLIFVAVTAGLAWVVTKQLLEVAERLPEYRANIHDKIEALHAPTTGAFARATQSVKEISKELSTVAPSPPPTGRSGRTEARPLPVQVVAPQQNDLQYLGSLLKPALKPVGIAGIVLVFTIFILIKREDLRNRLLRLVGLGQLNVVTEALDDGAQRISRYLLMQFMVNAAYGLLFGLGLFFIGVPNATLWGVIAGVLRIIPYLGALTGAALPLILALAVFNTWLPPVLVFVLYAVLEGVTGNFIEPWLYGAHTGVSSLALLVTTAFWTVLWGWAGLILSTPLTVCVIVLGRYVPQLSFLPILLGDEPALAEHAHFYQRLLAMDQTEARAIAETFLKNGHALVELYDSVVLPALSLAEQDRHKGALDDSRESFVFLSVTELIAELAEFKPETSASAPDAKPAEPVHHSLSRVVSIPANDQADEITAAMLSQLLEQAGYSVIAFPVNSGWEEPLKAFSLGPQDIVCVSSLPPFAFTHARSACQRVRAALPNVRIIVGLWGFTGDAEKMKERFGSVRLDALATTLAAATVEIAQSQTEEPETKKLPAAEPVANLA